MSRKVTLDTRVMRACGIVTLYEGDDSSLFKTKLVNLFNSLVSMKHFYFILHDDSELLHFHFIVILDAQVRLKTLLNRISDYLLIDVNRIGVEKLSDLNAQLRYFLHLEEDKSKKRYDIIDIVSDENIDIIKRYLQTDDDCLNSNRLFALVMYFDDKVDLLNYLDISTYHKFRFEIDLLYERRMYLLTHYKHLKIDNLNGDENLPF